MEAPRLMAWTVAAAALAGIIATIAPQSVPVMLNKLALAVLAGVTAYWLDRSLFPYARPDRVVDDPEGEGAWSVADAIAFGAAMLRRAIIVAGVIVAVSLGL